MSGSRSLGSMIVRLAAEGVSAYKADMSAAADATEKTGRASDSLGGSLGKLTNPVGAADLSMQLLARAGNLVAGAFAAVKVADLVRDSAMAAARFETMGVVMKVAGNNAGYSGQQTQEYAKKLQESGISMLQSRNAITQLATAHIDLSNAQKLGRAAQDLAVVGNVNSSEALGRLVDGIKSGEVEVLKSLGLNVSFEASYKKLATQLGTTTDKLTEQQKMMARTDIALEESARYTGIYEESMTTAGKAITSLTRYWDDFKVKAGDAFLPSLATGVFGVTDALKAMNKELSDAGQREGEVAGALNVGLKVALQTVSVLGANVAFVLKGIGREIGALAAQAEAVARGDFKAAFGIGGIGDMVTADGEKARLALDKFEQKILSTAEVEAKVSRDRLKTRSERDAGDSWAATTAAQAKAAEDAAKSAKVQAAEYKSLNSEIEKAGFLALSELDSGVKLGEADKFRVETLEKLISSYQDGKLSLQQYIDLESRMTDTEGVKRIMDEAKTAQKSADERAVTRKKEADGIDEFMQSQTEAYNAAVKGSEDALKAAKAEYDQYGLSKSQIAEITLLTLQSTQAKFVDGSEGFNAVQKQIDAQKELIGVLQKGESREAVKSLADENRRAAQQSGQYWEDALMRAFESGKGFFEAMWSSIKNTLQSQALKVFVQPVGTALGGALGLSGAANAGTTGNSLTSLLGTASGGLTDLMGASSMGTLDIAGFSVPQIGLALAGLSLLSSIGGKFVSASDSGRARVDYSAQGLGGGAYSTTGDASQTAAAQSSVETLSQSYFKTAAELGINAMAATFEYGSNTGKEGANSQTVLGVKLGKASYSSGEVSSGDSTALTLAASRAVLTALQASELPAYLSGVFDDMTASTATQEQINAALSGATAMKGFHDQLQALPWESLKDLSYKAAQGLAAAAGGLDKLTGYLGTYYDKFYSTQEKTALETENLSRSFAAIGITLPEIDSSTRAWYRSTVDALMAQDQSIAANAQATATALALASAVDQLAPALANTAGMAVDSAKAAVDAAKTARDALASLASAAVDYASKAMSQVSASVDAERVRINDAYAKQSASVQASIDWVSASVAKLATLSQSLHSALNGMSVAGADGANRAQAQAQISAALESARKGGGLPMDGQLTAALATVAKPSEKLYGTFEEYATDFYKTANDIAALSGLTDSQLSASESMEALLGQQLKQIEAAQKADLSGLDKTLAAAQSQLDALNGINGSVLSVADAIAALSDAVSKATEATKASQAAQNADIKAYVIDALGKQSEHQAAVDIATKMATQGYAPDRVGAALGISGQQVTDFYTNNNVAGYVSAGAAAQADVVHADQSARNSAIRKFALSLTGSDIEIAMALASRAKAEGIQEAEVAAALGKSTGQARAFFAAAGIPQFADGGDHSGGLRWVGEKGVELEATGASRIWNADQISGALRGSQGNNAEIAAALREMAARLDRIDANTRATAGHTAGTDRKLARVIPGNALITEVAV